MKRIKHLMMVTCIGLGIHAGAQPDDFFTPPEDLQRLSPAGRAEEELPNVLLVGDSISIGYTPFVMQQLAGRATVQRIPVNGGDTKRGRACLDEWLGTSKWDVIHFNFGLHDLCYRHPDSNVYGHRDKLRGTLSVPLEEYKENLVQIVQRLKETGAVLIWATTTVVPENEAGRYAGDEVKYNQAAYEVMRRHQVLINDLHALTDSFHDPSLFRNQTEDVHYTEKGSKKLAERVVLAIEKELNRGAPDTKKGEDCEL